MLTHAFWTVAPGRGEIRQVELAPPAPGEVSVRACFSGVSRGTESLIFSGGVPASEYERMRAPFQQGALPGPVKYGYASVGVVEAAGGKDGAELVGRDVFCLYPHQHRYVVPVAAVVPLPAGLPSARAVLAANMETAVNGLWDGCPAVGDRIAVIGGGVVGSLVAWLCSRIPGTRVELIDIDPARALLADALGVEFRLPERAEAGCDLVYHASGKPAGARQALALAGQEARVIEMSWFGREEVSLPLGEAFHARRLTLCSSQVGGIAAARAARWTHRQRMALALSMLTDVRLDALISGESDFFDMPTVMPVILGQGSGALCQRIRYPGG
jgi:threonine dehydrogenase-like Zn-dependent dehydrogenase